MIDKITRQANHLLLTPAPCPDWDNFIDWARKLLNNCNSCITATTDCGADRHMITFTFSQNRFSLNYESYSDSIWIDTDEPSAIDELDALSATIAAHWPHGNEHSEHHNNQP